MTRELYERCTLCEGTGRQTVFERGQGHDGLKCFGCQGVGFLETGLFAGQVDRLVKAEHRRQGDPAVLPDRGPIPEEEAQSLGLLYRRQVVAIVATEAGSNKFRTSFYGQDPQGKLVSEGLAMMFEYVFDSNLNGLMRWIDRARMPAGQGLENRG